MNNWLQWFTSLGISKFDSEDVAMWKRIWTGATFFGIFNLPIFGLLLWFFDAHATALGMFSYALVNAVSLPIFLYNKKLPWYRNLHLALLGTAPGIYTITMGGVLASGLLLIWCMWMPVAALAGGPRKQAARWAIFAAIVIVTTAIAVQYTPTFDQPPLILSEIIGTMSMISVGIFLFKILDSFVQQRNASRTQLAAEKARSEELLLNVLPESIAQRLYDGEQVIADRFEGVSILFADMVGFTALSERTDAEEVVALLNDLFTRFDKLVETYDVEKIRTIGDAYMVVAGAPIPRRDHAEVMVKLALSMADELAAYREENNLDIDFRIGINSGSAIGAIIGKSKFHYDVWGDAVNLAERMESHGVPGHIQIAPQTKAFLGNEFEFESRGKVDIKGKGLMDTWFVSRNFPKRDFAG